jgi:hypothetical protein
MAQFGFKKMFDLDSYIPESSDLDDLAKIMSNSWQYHVDTHLDRLFTTTAAANTPPPIPAGYTYFAQFISHDISFDSASDRHVRDDRPFDPLPLELIPELIKNLKNRRDPNFNLEAIYGHENPRNDGEIPRYHS